MLLRLDRVSWPVFRFLGYDPTHTAPRVGQITFEAGNQVNMQVRHGLTCGSAIIDTNVVALRVQFFVQRSLGMVKQAQKVAAFQVRQIEK
jgi:hypothetical protein